MANKGDFNENESQIKRRRRLPLELQCEMEQYQKQQQQNIDALTEEKKWNNGRGHLPLRRINRTITDLSYNSSHINSSSAVPDLPMEKLRILSDDAIDINEALLKCWPVFAMLFSSSWILQPLQ
uniref:Uncharacterized protein n=1 Tax=Globodera rostochiensis TaxID=31243 RepID=A0A914H7I4_GLORO